MSDEGGREQPLGPIVDSQGATITLADGDLVASTVTIAKVVNAQGRVSLALCCSEGLSWIERIGLITAASDIVRAPNYVDRFEED